MEELIKQRIEVYQKDLESIRNKIPFAFEEEEFKELNNRYDRFVAIIEELEFILEKIKEV